MSEGVGWGKSRRSTTAVCSEVVFTGTRGHEVFAVAGFEVGEAAFGFDECGDVAEVAWGGLGEGFGAECDAVAVAESAQPARGECGIAPVGSDECAEDGAGGVGIASEVDDLDEGFFGGIGGEEEVEAGGDAGGWEAHGGASAVGLRSVSICLFDECCVGTVARQFEQRFDVCDGGGDGVLVVTEREDGVGMGADDPVDGGSDVVGEFEEEAGFAGLAAGDAPDGEGDGHGAGEAADIAVGEEAGFEHGFTELVGVVVEQTERRDAHGGADARGVLGAVFGSGAAMEFFKDAAEAAAHTAVGAVLCVAGVGECDKGACEPVDVDAAVLEQALGQDEGELGVV